jgi:hypothetical protein
MKPQAQLLDDLLDNANPRIEFLSSGFTRALAGAIGGNAEAAQTAHHCAQALARHYAELAEVLQNHLATKENQA